MPNVLNISGKMQSGKSNVVKYLYGLHMVNRRIITHFDFDANGDLLVPFVGGGDELGIFDIYRRDEQFVNFLYGSKLAESIQRFSFADQLKAACTNIFGIDPMLYLTDAGKNTETHIKWDDFAPLLRSDVRKKLKEEGKLQGNMTVRQVLQYFGTDVCRKLDDDCWVRSTWDAISQCEAGLVVVDDCRFPNEFHYSKAQGAKTIRLKRNPKKSDVISETAMDEIPDSEYDLVIDNENMTMAEKNQLVGDFLISCGWLQGQL
jgi:hypothetical protein